MLTAIERQAILSCLTQLGTHAHDNELPLLAALIQTPVRHHRDPTAQYLGVRPLPVPDHIWADADSPVAGLQHAADDLLASSVRTQLAAAPEDLHLLAWVFMHTAATNHDVAAQVRIVEAVDIDDVVYRHTHGPGEADHTTTISSTSLAEDTVPVTVLRQLARDLRTG